MSKVKISALAISGGNDDKQDGNNEPKRNCTFRGDPKGYFKTGQARDSSRTTQANEPPGENLKQSYLIEGAIGLISRRRGKTSNNRLDDALKSQVIELIRRHYLDFGPTLACEKLLQQHQIKLSKESVRQLMIHDGLWRGRKRKVITAHPQRRRRSALGELVQIDGATPHAWLEDRGERCCLLVIIDDATSRLLALRFEPVENTQGYFRLFKTYLKKYGRPLACYHDKHGIFQVNAKESVNGNGSTQFERAMNELGIESISAHTPQAKGRVERVNKTLQDRLVKELRLQGISDIETANAFLPQFIDDFNQKFAVQPRDEDDAHRQSLPDEGILDLLLSEQHSRKISKNLEVSFQHKIYQINIKAPGYTMRGARLTVCVGANKEITLLYKNKKLPFTLHEKQKKISQVATAKEVNVLVDQLKRAGQTQGHKPSPHHPWRHYPNQSPPKNQVSAPA